MIIAVDGTAASGKGTLAKALAAELGLAHLDTGALYRACGLTLMLEGADPSSVDEHAAEIAAKNLDFSLTEDARIRTAEAGEMASVVAAMPEVRAALLEGQRRFAYSVTPELKDGLRKGLRGAILDGRDIGTVVLPDADYKFFVDADVDIRAHRRWKELINHGSEAMLPAIMEDLVKRDERDRSRQHAPLKPADNAILVDTTEKSVEEMVRFALKAIGQQPLPGKS